MHSLYVFHIGYDYASFLIIFAFLFVLQNLLHIFLLGKIFYILLLINNGAILFHRINFSFFFHRIHLQNFISISLCIIFSVILNNLIATLELLCMNFFILLDREEMIDCKINCCLKIKWIFNKKLTILINIRI